MTEITDVLNLNGINGIKFCEHYNTIFHLLFADDIFLVTESIEGLQNQLNVFNFNLTDLVWKLIKKKYKLLYSEKGGLLLKRKNGSMITQNLILLIPIVILVLISQLN